ncbi:MAG: ATP-binding protein [Gammaproteobacteria bacterium]
MQRFQQAAILKDLNKKIVFLVGPRQVGKTWLSKNIAQAFFKNSLYLSYDKITDREIIKKQAWLPTCDLLILDELHKMEDWKNYLKGLYDTKPENMKILVTGSARLDTFQHIGDSLAGRYFLHHLLPFSLAELNQISEILDIEKLQERGGFPEPYLAENILEANRWRLQYVNSLLSTDVFEFEQINNMRAIKLLFELLRHRVGSTISYQSLAEDIAISPITVKKYIEILEALYIIFRITPYSKNIARSLLKEPKIYFFDTALVQGDEGAKFENFVALSLLKHVYGKVDYLAEEYVLHYLRTKDGLEVDFALVKENTVMQILEAKLSDSKINAPLKYFHQKYNYPAVQIVKYLQNEFLSGDIEVLNAKKFLTSLFL